LRLVVVGGRYFPTIWEHGRSRALTLDDPVRTIMGRESVAQLTSRELAVLSVLGQGAPNKMIAFRLGITVSTVKAHVHSIIRKLKVRNRTEAAAFARLCQERRGWPANARHAGSDGVGPRLQGPFAATALCWGGVFLAHGVTVAFGA
jgi:DNA-binding CsgD family transcriptional regulator